MLSYRYAMGQLRNMREKWYKAPRRRKSKLEITEFDHKSYARSAMNEIERYLMLNQNGDMVDAVDRFRSMVDDLACSAKTPNGKYMYAVYYDVATDVMDMFLTLERR